MSFEGHARYYSAAAMVIVALSFFPIMSGGDGEDAYSIQGGAFGGLLDSHGPEVTFVGERAFVLLVLVGLLLVATFSRGPGLVGSGWGIAGFAALFVVLTVADPQAREMDASLTEAGQASVAVLVLTAAVGIVHEVRLVGHGRRERDRQVRETEGERDGAGTARDRADGA